MRKYLKQLLKWVEGAKENPASAIGHNQYPDGLQYADYSQRLHLATYTVDVWAYASIRAISRSISQIPLLVQQQSGDGWDSIDKGDLYDLLNRPNPDEPTTHLIGRWITSLLSAGDAYLLYDSGDNELYYVKPDLVKIKTDKMGRFVGYKISDGVRTLSQEPEQLVHIKLVNPDGDWYGFPPSHVIKETILTKIALSGYLGKYFRNNAMVGTSFSTDQVLVEEQRAELRQEFDRMHKGVDSSNAMGLAILDGGTKLDNLSHNLKDLIPQELYKMIREEVLAAYGVPHVMVGVLDDASYANADIQKRLFYENTVLPLIAEVEGFMNLQLVPQFGEGLRLRFDRTVIQALQEKPLEKADRMNKLVNGRNQIITVNEARIEVGFEAMDDEFLDELNPAPVAVPLPDMEEEPEEEKQKKILKIKEKRWKAHHSKVLKAEQIYAGLIVSFMDDQESRVLARLTDLSFNGKFLSSTLERELKMMEYKTLRDDTNVLFNKRREDRLLKKAMLPQTKKELAISGQQAINSHGKKDFTPIDRKGEQFRLTDPAVQKQLKRFMNRLVKVNDTTYDAIKDIIARAIDEGLSVEAVATQIKKEFNQITRVRSKLIAKTEMNGIINAGTWLGGGQAGATMKEWISAFISTTRPEHADADSQIVKMNKPFNVGGELLMFPGDPTGSVGNVANCYCSTLSFEE